MLYQNKNLKKQVKFNQPFLSIIRILCTCKN
jgi:hypothetical protein